MTYFVMLIMQHPKMLLNIDYIKLIAIIVVNLVLLFAILKLPQTHVFLKHLISLAYVASASAILCLMFVFFDSKAVTTAAILSLVLFIILSVLAHNFQQLISSKISFAVFVTFILLAIAEFVVGMFYPSSLLEKALILAVLTVVCYLVLVKTKAMIEHQVTCTNPDYVKESIGFVVSFQNIIVRILQLRRGGGRRR